MTAPKKPNGSMLKIAIPIFVALLGLGTYNTSAHSSLNDRVYENDAKRREDSAEMRGDMKVLIERSERMEKKVDRLLEK